MTDNEPRLTGALRPSKQGKKGKVPAPIQNLLADPRRRLMAVVGAAALVGGLAGAGIVAAATPAVTETQEYERLEARLADTVEAKDQDIDEQREQISDLRVEKGKLEAAASDVEDQQIAADARDAELAARETAVSAAETAKEASEFGNGVHIVGTNVTAGTYSIASSTDCYYAWMSGTGSDADIIDNNIVSGPATVTLRDGDVFETNRCGTWTRSN